MTLQKKKLGMWTSDNFFCQFVSVIVKVYLYLEYTLANIFLARVYSLAKFLAKVYSS